MKDAVSKIYRAIKYPLWVLIGAYVAFVVADNLDAHALQISFIFFVSFLVWIVVSNSNFEKKILASVEELKVEHAVITEQKILQLAFARLAGEFYWYMWIFGFLVFPILNWLNK